MEIRPGGACFYPDTVIAHSSFAFNSYWQREKNNGGSCDFGGAAIVVSSDPSITIPFSLKQFFFLDLKEIL